MANKLVLVPEAIYRGLTTTDVGEPNLDFTRHQLDKIRRSRTKPPIKNIRLNQELRRYLTLRNERENRPIKVQMISTPNGTWKSAKTTQSVGVSTYDDDDPNEQFWMDESMPAPFASSPRLSTLPSVSSASIPTSAPSVYESIIGEEEDNEEQQSYTRQPSRPSAPDEYLPYGIMRRQWARNPKRGRRESEAEAGGPGMKQARLEEGATDNNGRPRPRRPRGRRTTAPDTAILVRHTAPQTTTTTQPSSPPEELEQIAAAALLEMATMRNPKRHATEDGGREHTKQARIEEEEEDLPRVSSNTRARSRQRRAVPDTVGRVRHQAPSAVLTPRRPTQIDILEEDAVHEAANAPLVEIPEPETSRIRRWEASNGEQQQQQPQARRQPSKQSRASNSDESKKKLRKKQEGYIKKQVAQRRGTTRQPTLSEYVRRWMNERKWATARPTQQDLNPIEAEAAEQEQQQEGEEHEQPSTSQAVAPSYAPPPPPSIGSKRRPPRSLRPEPFAYPRKIAKTNPQPPGRHRGGTPPPIKQFKPTLW